MTFLNQAKDHFDRMSSALKLPEQKLRRDMWAKFQDEGFPDFKSERWRYTNLRSVTQADWKIESNSSAAKLPEKWANWCLKWSKHSDVLVCFDGQYRPDLSIVIEARGLQVEAAELKTFDFEVDGFWGLNLSISKSGYSLRVPASTQLERPVFVLNFVSQMNAWSSVFNELVLEPGSSATVFELQVSVDGTFVANDLTLARLKKGAKLDWVRVQDLAQEGFGFSEQVVEVGEAAELNWTQMQAGSELARGSLTAKMLGREAKAHVNGLTFGRSKQHLDQRILMSHEVGETESSQLFKGIFKDRSRGVLNGKIYIAKNAQKVLSNQLNHNLLLSPGAEADTKPELEVYADDVKANHGASVGRLSDEQLFYLQSRGIPKHLAAQILARAFVDDVVLKVENRFVRQALEECIESVLPHFATEMELDS